MTNFCSWKKKLIEMRKEIRWEPLIILHNGLAEAAILVSSTLFASVFHSKRFPLFFTNCKVWATKVSVAFMPVISFACPSNECLCWISPTFLQRLLWVLVCLQSMLTQVTSKIHVNIARTIGTIVMKKAMFPKEVPIKMHVEKDFYRRHAQSYKI